MAHSRREFLVGSGCGLLSGAAFLTGFEKLSLMSLFAGEAAEKTGADTYKALVCVFLFGGNDANNMLIPYDNYADYATPRAGASFLIQQSELLPINPPSAGGATFGVPFANATIYDFRPIQQLCNDNKLAFVVTMGTLVQPLTRDDYLRGSPRPQQLFSHSNEQEQNQTSVSTVSSRTGWGGRLADRMLTSEQFPADISISGVQIFGSALRQSPLVVPPAPQTL